MLRAAPALLHCSCSQARSCNCFVFEILPLSLHWPLVTPRSSLLAARSIILGSALFAPFSSLLTPRPLLAPRFSLLATHSLLLASCSALLAPVCSHAIVALSIARWIGLVRSSCAPVQPLGSPWGRGRTPRDNLIRILFLKSFQRTLHRVSWSKSAQALNFLNALHLAALCVPRSASRGIPSCAERERGTRPWEAKRGRHTRRNEKPALDRDCQHHGRSDHMALRRWTLAALTLTVPWLLRGRVPSTSREPLGKFSRHSLVGADLRDPYREVGRKVMQGDRILSSPMYAFVPLSRVSRMGGGGLTRGHIVKHMGARGWATPGIHIYIYIYTQHIVCVYIYIYIHV